jgi:hypothetical protein
MNKHTRKRNHGGKRNSKRRQKRISKKMKGSANLSYYANRLVSKITGRPNTKFLYKLGLDIDKLNKDAFYLHADHVNTVGLRLQFIINVSKIISEKARDIYVIERNSIIPGDSNSTADPAMITLQYFDEITVHKILDACCEKLGYVTDNYNNYIQIDINIGKKILLYADRVFDNIHKNIIENSRINSITIVSILPKIIRDSISTVAP